MATREKLSEAGLPRRACVLKLEIEADGVDELVGVLRHIQYRLRIGDITHGVSGGFSSGYSYSFDHDPSITHDSWFEASEAYWKAKDEPHP